MTAETEPNRRLEIRWSFSPLWIVRILFADLLSTSLTVIEPFRTLFGSPRRAWNLFRGRIYSRLEGVQKLQPVSNPRHGQSIPRLEDQREQQSNRTATGDRTPIHQRQPRYLFLQVRFWFSSSYSSLPLAIHCAHRMYCTVTVLIWFEVN